jgi:hypothetical protein
MIPPPIPIGLTVCDYVIVEEGTGKVSLIGSYSDIGVPHFPAVAPPFCVVATLTNGQGNATIELTLTHLETDEETHSVRQTVQFPSRFTEVLLLYRIAGWTFPEAGTYLFTLQVDGEWIAHRRVHVHTTEDTP